MGACNAIIGQNVMLHVQIACYIGTDVERILRTVKSQAHSTCLL